MSPHLGGDLGIGEGGQEMEQEEPTEQVGVERGQRLTPVESFLITFKGQDRTAP